MHARILFILALAAPAAFAHHGWSSYDSRQTLSVSGTIVEASYSYPHATIRIEGAGQSWLAVLAPPARLSVRGLPGERLRIGESVTVEGYPSRRRADELRAERITVGGRTVELR